MIVSVIFVLLISEYFKFCICEDMSNSLRKEILYNILIEFDLILKVFG
jgi:hypothetical protein